LAKLLPGDTSEGTTIAAIIESRTLKAKDKIIQIGELILTGMTSMNAVILAVKSKRGSNMATLMAALEFASKTKPEIITDKVFFFAIESLQDDAPRVKWEAAKVISNSAHLFPEHLKKAVVYLLPNTEHEGTVVRWSAATALSKIIQVNGPVNKELIPAVQSILKWEQDRAITKIYQNALKKAQA